MELKIFSDSKNASEYTAKEVAKLITERNSKEEHTVLGLATGNTPVQFYKELIGYHKEGLSFKKVITFNLDEFYPMQASRKESFHSFMNTHFFKHVDIPEENIHIPDGEIPGDYVKSFCDAYENKIKKAGGIDIQILGIGRNGHVGFNEPGSRRNSITRLVHLDEMTRKDAAKEFNGIQNVPKMAITMGIRTILDAKKIYLLSFGERKAEIINKCFYDKISSGNPASYLQKEENIEVILDQKAGALIKDETTN